MTVCIAAICDGGKSVVVASDRMLTSNFPPIEFEHTRTKIFRLSDHCLSMTSGDALKPIEVIPKIQESINEQKNPPNIGVIVDIAKSWYQNLRLAQAEELFLKPRTINAKVFYSEGSKIFPTNVYGFLDSQFTEFNYGLDLLIAGADTSGAHIYAVVNPGISGCYDIVGFHAIGVGQMHAVQSFVAHRYDTATSLAKCLHIVYAAKKASESAPGVGVNTDMCFLVDGKTQILDEEFIKKLDEIYQKVTDPRHEEIEKAEQLLEEMTRNAKMSEDNPQGKEAAPNGK